MHNAHSSLEYGGWGVGAELPCSNRRKINEEVKIDSLMWWRVLGAT